MELQIQDLIDSIKSDGIQEAQKQKDEIIKNANSQAEGIVKDAEKEATVILEKARKEAAVLEVSGKEAVRQASRDVILSLKKSINSTMEGLLKTKVTKSFDEKQLAQLVVEVVKSGIADSSASAVEVKKGSVKALQASLAQDLDKELKGGLVIRMNTEVESGFRYADAEGKSYYDFSDEEISALLIPYLNAAVADILTGSDKT